MQLLLKQRQRQIGAKNGAFPNHGAAPVRGHPGAGLESRLFTTATDRAKATSLADARVLIVGFSADQLPGLRRSIQRVGVRGIGSTPSVQKLDMFSEMKSAFSHVVVNFDAFEDTESGVDALFTFRMQASEFVIILCSAYASGDDFGTERAAICDATLRLPVSEHRVRAGLMAGTENHADRCNGYRKAALS